MPFLLYFSGLLLLIIPTGPLTRDRYIGLTLRQLALRERYHFKWLHLPNLLDLLRAWGGLTLLQHSFLEVDPLRQGGGLIPLATLTIVALAGTLMQQLFHSLEPDVIPAPCAFTVGLLLALLPLQVTLLVLPISYLAARGSLNLHAGKIVTIITLFGFGYLFKISPLYLASAAAITLLPIAVASALCRHLVITVRRQNAVQPAPLRDIPNLPGKRA